MELSMVATFDELKRCQDILTDGTAEIEFRRFLQVMEESRQQWQATTAEAQRLQRELDKYAQERSEYETKLSHARKMLETESKARRALEKQNELLISHSYKSAFNQQRFLSLQIGSYSHNSIASYQCDFQSGQPEQPTLKIN